MQTPVSNGFSVARLGARAVLWVLASSLGAVAEGQQTAPDVPDGQDTAGEVAPERVARLSFTQGGVSLQAVGETAWAPATLNRPLTPGDFVRTEGDGRAELQVGEATVRVGSATSFTFLKLDDDALRMRVTSGVVNLRVRTLGENEVVEVETPQATASILRPGTYRLEVNPNGGATVVKVSSGMLEARGAAEQSFVVRAQQAATLTGTSRLAFTTATLGAPDAFDQWALERDRRDDHVLSSDSARYVPGDVVGYEDLDSYGTWISEPRYGYVWTPTRVVAGWSPYMYGRYSYVGGWGWTWIDDAPWGFAPYHYGSWITIGSRWCWVPGPRHGYPIGRPVADTPIGQPSQPRHGWHVPPPPRGVTVRAGVPSRENDAGTRSSFATTDRQWDGRSDNNGNRGGYWRGSRDGNTSGSHLRTVPDGDGYRYVRPGVPRNEMPQSGSAVSPVPSAAPPATLPPADDRRVHIPRYETPQNTFPRNSELPRPEVSRPSPPPQQQQQQSPQQPARADSPHSTFDRGGGDRSPGGRPRTLER
jgi:hypothetical protein